MVFMRRAVPDEAKAFAAAASDRLYPLAWSLTGSRVDAEDLVQESLVAVMTRWEKIVRADNPNAYVRRLMINTHLSGRRRRSATEVTVAEPLDRPVSDLTGDVAERSALAQRLQLLDARQRAVLVLRYYEDLADAAIAELLDTTPGNVRVIAHRALARLRAAEEDEPESDADHARAPWVPSAPARLVSGQAPVG